MQAKALKSSLLPYLAVFLGMSGLAGCNRPEAPAEPIDYAAAVGGEMTGLDFPSNGEGDARFKFTGSALLPMYPATYVWRVNMRKQEGYYSTFFWSPDGAFTGASYYGVHPFPATEPRYASTSHRWSISLDGGDESRDVGGAPTDLGYGEWKTQALRVYDGGGRKVHEFFWDLPDTTKMIRFLAWPSYGNPKPEHPALTFGGAPWNPGNQNLAGVLRGIQIYADGLDSRDLVAELEDPLSTQAGMKSIWYLNVNPTPDDIQDKSGRGHHPAWAGPGRPALWKEKASAPAPILDLSADILSFTGPGEATLTWTSAYAKSCEASGAWSGPQDLSGSVKTGPLSATGEFALSCTGPGGTTARTIVIEILPLPLPIPDPKPDPDPIPLPIPDPVVVPIPDPIEIPLPDPIVPKPVPVPDPKPDPVPAPALGFSAAPEAIPFGGTAQLAWSASHADGCEASGDWSGARPVQGSLTVGPLFANASFSLACDGAGGKDSRTVKVSVKAKEPAPGGSQSGLDFPSNDDPGQDVRFRFKGKALQPMYPATYVFRVKLRRQAGYYTTFFWGPDGAFTGTGYYGMHPYPEGEPKPASKSHSWEVSVNGNDYVKDSNGHGTAVAYDTWVTQAARVYAEGNHKVHEFFYDLPDTAKVIRAIVYDSYNPPSDPALTFGDAPWSIGNERLSGVLRGIQTYGSALSGADILSELDAPGGTAAGKGSLWYLNLDPTPQDISDKSGNGHHPEWVGQSRPGAWTGP